MKRTLAPGVTINTTCLRKDHRWRPKVAYQVGTEVCRRRGCRATRLNPEFEAAANRMWDEIRAHGEAP